MKNVLACRAIGGEGTFGLNRSQRPDVVWVCDHGRHCQRSLGEGLLRRCAVLANAVVCIMAEMFPAVSFHLAISLRLFTA